MTSWLALLHQLPAKPPYLRVKIWRRLQSIGAVPLKNAVHVLPHSDDCEAAFRALLEEITSSGGEAILTETRLLAGQSDAEVRTLFDTARDADYDDLAQSARGRDDYGWRAEFIQLARSASSAAAMPAAENALGSR